MNKKKIIKLVFLPFFWLNKQVKHTNWYKNAIPDIGNYPTNEWYRKNVERNYDIVNLGSSSAVYAFDYTEIGLKAFNWALQPQSMEYSFKVLQNFFSILRPKGIVMIPLCPLSALKVDTWSAMANDRYYHILSPELIENYKEVAKRRQYPLLCLTKDSLKRLIKDVPQKGMQNKICKSREDFKQDAKKWIDSWSREFDIVDLDATLSEQNKNRMQNRMTTVSEMVSFCQVRNLQPVIVITPMHSALAEQFSPEFRKNYLYAPFEKFSNQGILFLDYIDDERFAKDEYFINSFFMNKNGAKFFTKQVLEDLKLLK